MRGVFSVTDPDGNPLPLWTEGDTAYQQGDVLFFGDTVAVYNRDTGLVEFPDSSDWTSSGHSVMNTKNTSFQCPLARAL